jgi:hypothetical protein
MLPSIYFSGFFEDLTVPCTNLKNMDKMSKFEGTVNNIGYYNNISLRVRGMWLVEHPFRTFRDIFHVAKLDNNTCKLRALLDTESIYNKISVKDKHRAESLGLSVTRHDIPDNTGRIINSVAIYKDIELGGPNV